MRFSTLCANIVFLHKSPYYHQNKPAQYPWFSYIMWWLLCTIYKLHIWSHQEAIQIFKVRKYLKFASLIQILFLEFTVFYWRHVHRNKSDVSVWSSENIKHVQFTASLLWESADFLCLSNIFEFSSHTCHLELCKLVKVKKGDKIKKISRVWHQGL